VTVGALAARFTRLPAYPLHSVAMYFLKSLMEILLHLASCKRVNFTNVFRICLVGRLIGGIRKVRVVRSVVKFYQTIQLKP
jgi:hypothetical protein